MSVRPKNVLRPDKRAMRSQLDWLADGAPTEALLEVAWSAPGTSDIKFGLLFRTDEFEGAVKLGVQKNELGCNVYVGAALKKPTTRRDRRTNGKDFYWARAIPVDVDKDISRTQSRLKRVCEAAMSVTTGTIPEQRWQHWARLQEPCTNDQEFARGLEALVKHVGGDQNALGAGRLMRWGGTVSYPSGAKRAKGYVTELTQVTINRNAKPAALSRLTALAPLEDGILASSGIKYGPWGQITDGRETLWRNLVYANLKKYQQTHGHDPSEAELFDLAYEQFANSLRVNHSDCKWISKQGQRTLRQRVRHTLRREDEGKIRPQTGRESAADWRAALIKDLRGEPKGLLANVVTALGAPEWLDALSFDEFSLSTKLALAPPWEAEISGWRPRVWTDDDDVHLVDWLNHQGIHVTIQTAGRAVRTTSKKNSFHPVRDFLNALEWDGRDRIEGWLHAYMGAEDTALNAEIGKRFLIGAVARIMEPGCKQDQMLVFEGQQGIGKSTAVKVLAGEWYADGLADMGSKDAAIGLRSAWMHEVPELDAMNRVEVSKVKAFISRPTDTYRPPYGVNTIHQSRESVFIGTTNAEVYLKDETGGRRFWGVKVQEIDIDALIRDRDQLWAEAVDLYRRGEKWWITDHKLNAEAARAQADRYVADGWTDAVNKYISDRDSVSVAEIMKDCIRLEVGQQDHRHEIRVSRILAAAKWTRRRAPRSWLKKHAPELLKGSPPYRYWPPDD